MQIPVVLLGLDRPLTSFISDYLAGRNEARKGPGTFVVEKDMVWYRASTLQSDPSAIAATALAMQQAVEKTGPKILNLLR
jgi:hypothetical protein